MKNKIRVLKHKGVANVPQIMQLEALECGAASLTMIMAYYGKWVPLEEVRVEAGVSRDGVNAANILAAGEHYGLEAHGYKCEIEDLLTDGNFPCIIHWNFNHFVVLDGFKGNYAVINDPAKGKVKVPMEEFNTSFTGIVLEFSPTSDFVANGNKHSVINFAKKRLATSISALVFMTVMFVIFALLNLITPVFSRIFMDNILTYENPEWFTPFLWILVGFSIVKILVSGFNDYNSSKIQGKLNVSGSSSFMWKVLNLPVVFFSQRHIADIQNRKNDNASISETLIAVLAPALIDVALMLFYLIIMIRYSWVLTLVGIGSVILNGFVGALASKKRQSVSIIQLRDEGLLDSATLNTISIIETIKASGAESSVFEKWSGYQANLNNDEIKILKINVFLGSIPIFISSLADIAICILGVYFAMTSNFTIGMIVAFQGFFGGFVNPVNELIDSSQVIYEMKSKMERIEDVMDYPSAPVFKEDSLDSQEEFDKISGDIEIKNITFGYSVREAPLITDFSLTIKQGQKVAIVGPSGCGKSTLGKLLSGLYAPWSGSITFNGKTMSEIDRTIFSSSLDVVDQDVVLFEDTIANNITMWNDSIEDYEMILACKDAHIHDQIMARDHGYQHKLIEGGKNFSGGERQRLEIARALAAEPNYLILDEATSALDAKTESEVVQAIEDRGITTIVIAHRLSTIRTADVIIVLDHGKIVEKGTHEELMNKGGLYSKLVTSE